MDEMKGFKAVEEFDVVLQIPLKVRIKLLDEAHESAFVDDCMAHPYNCENDWTAAQNRAWFREMWQQQIKFQQALLQNPDYFRSFIGFCALDQAAMPSFFHGGRPLLPVPDLEDVAAPIAEYIGARQHFLPPNHLGVSTGCMLSVLLGEAMELRLGGDAAVVILE